MNHRQSFSSFIGNIKNKCSRVPNPARPVINRYEYCLYSSSESLAAVKRRYVIAKQHTSEIIPKEVVVSVFIYDTVCRKFAGNQSALNRCVPKKRFSLVLHLISQSINAVWKATGFRASIDIKPSITTAKMIEIS